MRFDRLLTVCMFVGGAWLTDLALAQRSDDTAQAYLRFNAAQQEIFLRRQLDAQRQLVADCIPDVSISNFRDDFNAWLTERPRFLTRSVQLAITTAITERCGR